MKKFFIILLTLVLSTTVFAGCDSCATVNEVSYVLNWAQSPTSGYTETCVYDVTYLTNYSENGYNYSKSDIGANVSITSGSYTTTTSIVSKNGLDIPEKDKHLDDSYDRTFYKLTTELDIEISYTINGVTELFNDKISSTSYFYDHNHGFAPIYSQKSYDTTNVELDTNGKASKILRYVYDTTTVYDGGDMTFTFTQPDVLPESTALSYCPAISTPTKTATGNYKNFIDNETLLFSLRNLNLSDSLYLDVAIPSYLGVETVAVSKVISGNKTVNLSVNGSDSFDATMSATTVAYYRSDDTYTGSPILATVQTDSFTHDGQSYDNAYLLKIVTRLPSYSGAIAYTLKKVTVMR